MSRLRRCWPILKLVPTPWLVPIVAPAATDLRRSFYRDAVAVVLLGSVLILAATLI